MGTSPTCTTSQGAARLTSRWWWSVTTSRRKSLWLGIGWLILSFLPSWSLACTRSLFSPKLQTSGHPHSPWKAALPVGGALASRDTVCDHPKMGAGGNISQIWVILQLYGLTY